MKTRFLGNGLKDEGLRYHNIINGKQFSTYYYYYIVICNKQKIVKAFSPLTKTHNTIRLESVTFFSTARFFHEGINSMMTSRKKRVILNSRKMEVGSGSVDNA